LAQTVQDRVGLEQLAGLLELRGSLVVALLGQCFLSIRQGRLVRLLLSLRLGLGLFAPGLLVGQSLLQLDTSLLALLLRLKASLHLLHLADQAFHLVGWPQPAGRLERGERGFVLLLGQQLLGLVEESGVLGLVARLLLLAAGQLLGLTPAAF